MAGKKILIVEDEIIIAESIARMLKSKGYDILPIALSGKEAIESTESHLPDLIVMDIILEDELDGIEAIKMIASRFNIPFVYITAQTDSVTLERATVTEPYGYIIKPINPQELFSTIKIALHKHETETILRDREERLTLALEVTDASIWELIVKENKIICNEKIMEILGFERKVIEWDRKEMEKLYHPEEKEEVRQFFDTLIQDKAENNSSEHRLKTRDGKWKWVSCRGKIVARDNQGRPERLLGTVIDISERKMIENNLNKSQKMYMTVAEASPNAVIMTDLDAQITYCNNQFALMMGGTSSEEFIGKNGVELVIQKEQERARTNLPRIFERGIIQNYETVLLKNDGSKFYAEINAAIYRNAADEPSGLIVVVQDITARKKAKEELAIFKRFAETSSLGYGFANLDGTMVYGNAKILEILEEKDTDALLGNNFSKYYPEDLRDYLWKILEVVRSSGTWTGELPMLSINGRLTPTLQNITLLCDDKGDPQYFGNIVTDISEIETVKLALVDSEKKSRILMDATDDAVCLIDSEGDILDLNRATAQILERDTGDLIGRSIFEFLPIKIAKKFLKTNLDQYDMDKPYYERHEYKKRLYDTFIHPIRDHEGRITMIAIYSRDITEIIEQQKMVMDAIENERRKLAQDLHDGISQKLAGVSYLAEALRQTLPESLESKRREVEDIRKNVEDSIEQVRRLSRGVFVKELDGYGLLPSLEELSQETSRIHRVNCNLSYDPITIDDSTIATNIYYIIQESIMNAIRHGVADTIDITIRENDESIEITIKDNGKKKPEGDITQKGIGQVIMRYRASLIGADFSVQRDDSGYEVSLIMSK